jgi:hypothetical protein
MIQRKKQVLFNTTRYIQYVIYPYYISLNSINDKNLEILLHSMFHIYKLNKLITL